MSRRYLVFIFFLLAYFLGYFLRSANAAIADDLSSTFNLAPDQLGLMTSLFFITFAATQIPFGIALDRFGARMTTATLLLIAVLGAVIFGSAQNTLTLMLGRALMGIGTAGSLMAAFEILAEYFPLRRYATIIGIMVALGASGGLAAADPLVQLSALIGWRAVFYVAAFFCLLIAVAIAIFARKGPLEPPAHSHDVGNLGDVFRNIDFWRVAWLNFAMLGAIFSFQGLWMAPYLEQGLGLSRAQMGFGLNILAFGAITGYFLSGWLCDRFGITKILSLSAILMLISKVILGLAPAELLAHSWWLRHSNIFIFGFTGASSLQLITQIRLLFPPSLSGRASTACNLVGFSGSAIVQWFLGIFVGFFAVNEVIPAHAYKYMFVVVAVILLAAIIFYLPLLRKQR